jgi:hypothetical protein
MKKSILFVFSLLLILTACSESPKTAQPAKEPAPPPEPMTGRDAFFKMFSVARGWSPDAQPLSLVSIRLDGVKVVPGLAAAWQASFMSPSKGKKRTWTYSVIEAEGNLHKGAFAGLEEGYSATGQAQPWIVAALKTDSDEVYKTALTKGAEYDKKNPGKTITFVLEKTSRFTDPAWRVIWGESVGTSNFSIFVDASTGKYLETMR